MSATNVKGELRLKEMGAGVEDFAPQPLLQQVAEAGGVVIVAVPDEHSFVPDTKSFLFLFSTI